jgi:hypothetical protein
MMQTRNGISAAKVNEKVGMKITKCPGDVSMERLRRDIEKGFRYFWENGRGGLRAAGGFLYRMQHDMNEAIARKKGAIK